MPETIFDNCVLSNFALSDSMAILKKMYSSKAYITDFVAAENMRGIQGHRGLAKIRLAVSEGWIKRVALDDSEKKVFEALSVSLGLGEASSVAIAKKRGFVFACDDRVARREASSLGVILTGTAGILLKASDIGLINREEADAILARMLKHGFYSPIKSINDVKGR